MKIYNAIPHMSNDMSEFFVLASFSRCGSDDLLTLYTVGVCAARLNDTVGVYAVRLNDSKTVI